MKIKIKLQNGISNELDLIEAFCTEPLIIEKEMIFAGYAACLEISDNIWYQLPEKIKRKVYKNKRRNVLLKNFVIKIGELTAYSVNWDNKNIEEIFKNFDENEYIISFYSSYCYSDSGIEMYFQNKGEIYIEFKAEDMLFMDNYEIYDVAEERKKWLQKIKNQKELAKIFQNKFYELQAIEREINQLEKLLRILSKEDIKKEFEIFLRKKENREETFYYYLTYLSILLKIKEEYQMEIPEEIKNKIGYWIYDMSSKIRTKEEKKLIEEISKNLKFK